MKRAYDQGTLLMLVETVERIGCGAEIPKDHKNEWLQNRFSLKPCARIRVPGQKGTHLVWREADVEKARRMWEEAKKNSGFRIQDSESGQTHVKDSKGANGAKAKPLQVTFGHIPPMNLAEELKAIEAETDGWKNMPADGMNEIMRREMARMMFDVGIDLMRQAMKTITENGSNQGKVPA